LPYTAGYTPTLYHKGETAVVFATPAAAARWLTETAAAFMRGPGNDLHMPDGPEPAFDPPFLGFASGADPVWSTFKEHVGPFHWTPAEAFALAYPDEAADAEELSVVSWILPQTEATRRDNRRGKVLPAHRWARARIFGEAVNMALRAHMVETIRERGIQAAAPSLLPEWSSIGLASVWSERHAAYAAGLGTFGLCDGLITRAGKAIRTGALVARLALPVTSRAYTDHREYCLYFNSGICGACIKRCPAGALGPEGHDKRACGAYLEDVTRPYVMQTWKFAGYGCGLCQVGVPCERGIPPRPAR
jgi:ferredoxin